MKMITKRYGRLSPLFIQPHLTPLLFQPLLLFGTREYVPRFYRKKEALMQETLLLTSLLL